MMDRVSKVNFNHPVMRPLRPVPCGVGEEDHMGTWEVNHSRVVLGRVEAAVLQFLSKVIQVIRMVNSSSGEIKDGNRAWIISEGVGHVLHSSREVDSISCCH